ncbi:MAG: DUF2158 domain-containing protein [Alphaproteobacteria bacterium]
MQSQKFGKPSQNINGKRSLFPRPHFSENTKTGSTDNSQRIPRNLHNSFFAFKHSQLGLLFISEIQLGVKTMADTFSVGDTVQLKSGGPIMTVTSVGDEYGEIKVNCTWFDKKDEQKYSSLSPETLAIVN